jgi:hypothetical protein
MVVAVAGRRIDAGDTSTPRFPLRNVPIVERRVDELFERLKATGLVASAACGADLIALTVAGRRNLRRRVVLPSSHETFRATSVIDRPGEWGPVYDRILSELAQTHDVVVLMQRSEGNEAYVAANHAILDEAARLARASNGEVVAVLIWEGVPRSDDDITAAFAEEARKRGCLVEQVKTL